MYRHAHSYVSFKTDAPAITEHMSLLWSLDENLIPGPCPRPDKGRDGGLDLKLSVNMCLQVVKKGLFFDFKYLSYCVRKVREMVRNALCLSSHLYDNFV